MTGALQRGCPRDDIRATSGGIFGGIAGTFIGGGDTGATPGVTAPSVTREQIEGHLSALRLLVKEHNSRGNVSLIRLNFDDLKDRTTARAVVTGKEFKMPINIKWYDGTTDLEDHLSRFSSAANSGEWPMPVPKTVDEMMVRLDDFVRSEEAFTNMELPKGEVSEESKKLVGPDSRKEDRFLKGGYGADRRRNDEMSAFNIRDGLAPYRP
ncbi:hypothetical protein Tco_1029723 [Tanacetum coccineum]|uniref:Uncharacterized protein n=1 Tax=Tanacetum coccineum TaxID=301880 RepID=A0ABQ5G611_9ASTR